MLVWRQIRIYFYGNPAFSAHVSVQLNKNWLNLEFFRLCTCGFAQKKPKKINKNVFFIRILTSPDLVLGFLRDLPVSGSRRS